MRLLLRKRKRDVKARTKRRRPPIPAPTPIPAFAAVLSFVGGGALAEVAEGSAVVENVVEDGIDVEMGAEEGVVEYTARTARIVMW